MNIDKATKRREWSWIMYDCGNSAYSMAVTTALFPILYGMYSGNAMTLGYWSSLASILVALLSPILGTIADFRDRKKRFFLFFALLGIITTAALALVPQGQWVGLVWLFVASEIGFAGANIFYDAFLVDVTEDERMDLVSTRGFAYGYIASILPFGICLAVVYLSGMEKPLGYQISFVITALWWGLFTIPLLRHVKQRYYVEPVPNPVAASFRRLGQTFREIRRYRYAFIFLIAYFFYIDGVDTIIRMVVPYATELFGSDALDTFGLLAILLLVQVVAFPCALLFGRLAKRFGTLFMIRVAIGIYLVVVAFAYQISSLAHIFVLACLIALAQGGIQALSRSYFARLIPKQKSNEFFGFYNIFGKFAAIMGPALMAFISAQTGSARHGVLGILPLFLIGFALSWLLPTEGAAVVEEVEGQAS
ncbi:MAG: MFS transporter [Bacillota bacterium]|nr:MFS transporter [Bacillota bacterium]